MRRRRYIHPSWSGLPEGGNAKSAHRSLSRLPRLEICCFREGVKDASDDIARRLHVAQCTRLSRTCLQLLHPGFLGRHFHGFAQTHRSVRDILEMAAPVFEYLFVMLFCRVFGGGWVVGGWGGASRRVSLCHVEVGGCERGKGGVALWRRAASDRARVERGKAASSDAWPTHTRMRTLTVLLLVVRCTALPTRVDPKPFLPRDCIRRVVILRTAPWTIDMTGSSEPGPWCTMIDLDSNNLGDAGAVALAEQLKINRKVVTLRIGANSIGDAGAIALAEALKVNRKLTSLDIGHNEIGPRGAKALVEALKSNRALSTLILYKNSIGASGATAIAEMLKYNRKLHTLELGNNAIGNTGAVALAEALKSNRKLVSLDLGLNSITDAGAIALRDAIRSNHVLVNLDLWRNPIGAQGASALAGAARVRWQR